MGADDDLSSDSAPGSAVRPKMRSVLYGFDPTKTSLYPLGGLPPTIKVRQVLIANLMIACHISLNNMSFIFR